MNRDKDNKTLQDKLKQFFKLSKTNSGHLKQSREFILTNEVLADLSKDVSTATRLKTMKELSELLLLNHLETNGVERVWSCVQDMFLKEYTTEVRHATFNFLQFLIKGQFETIDMMRAQFFRFIKHHENPQDLAQRVDLLTTLTNQGKEVKHFEEEIGPFLLTWMGEVKRVGKLYDYLLIVDNVIKFNSAYLDEYILSEYVKHLCVLCCNSTQYEIVVISLQILGTVVAYSILPHESLGQFVGTLCRTVNVSCYCLASWKTMKNLLGTHLGHSALFTMCRFLQEVNLSHDEGLIRGCVFYIHMALWDINAMQNLVCPPSSVLPSVLRAAQCNHATVNHELILGIQKLINKHGLELLEHTWDIVLEINLLVLKQIELNPKQIPNNQTIVVLHEILNTIENLVEVGSYKGSLKQFFGVIHECSRDRPESSVLKLVKYLSENIRPTENAWLKNLFNLLTNYFRADIRTNIRLKVLSVLSNVIEIYGEYEDELINRIVIPHMQPIVNDENTVIRTEVAKLLINLGLDYNSSICMEVLDILKKLLLRPYDRFAVDRGDTNFHDIEELVPGLIKIFAKKIHRLPSQHAIKVHRMFVLFLEKHLKSMVFANYKEARMLILDCLLSMRADSICRLGYPHPTTGKIKFSTYLCVTYKQVEPVILLPPTTQTSSIPVCKISYLSLESTFKLILAYLKEEKDWEVLKLILTKLPLMLENKAIILTRSGNYELNNLVAILCSMVQLKERPLGLTDYHNVKGLEYQTAVVSVMVSLSSYGGSLDQKHQQLLIRTLKETSGKYPRYSRQPINALTICMIDMRETMMKELPDVLLRLSKISANENIAMPILEFLSTLSQLPTVYGNFVGDQYMAVFAIALPYTNPFKFGHYIVSLAYHVISVWFLKCRLPFRKEFVKFIVSGLQTNVIVPFKELTQFNLSHSSSVNQDSSDRKRSSSLTEPGSRRRVSKLEPGPKSLIQTTQRDKTVLTFYEELNETCIDLMARYTYSPCSALPTRLPTAEFLLNGGLSKSWMVGNKLITITTSGCTEKVSKHGVCEKCWSVCGSHNNSKIARYARSNSGNDDKDSFLMRQNSADKSAEEGKKSGDSGEFPNMVGDDHNRDPPICACWCQGWAEVLIRRPTGNVSWVMKVQNQVSFKQLVYEFPLNEMATLFMPDLHFEPNSAISIEEKEESEDQAPETCASCSRPVSVTGSPTKQSLSRQSSRDSGEEELEFVYDDGTKTRNPVRRSNSSPEIPNWKNPIVHQRLDQDGAKKDVRVSCEAIPEEMLAIGTSTLHTSDNKAPKNEHLSLLTCHSYPGSSPPAESNIAPKPYKTVPPSPHQLSNQPGFPPQEHSPLERPNNLPNLSSLVPLSSKPPQSPTQTSPRLQRHMVERDRDGLPIQKSSSSSKLEKSRTKPIMDFAEKRDRVHTVSVMSTSTRKPSNLKSNLRKEHLKSGLNPSFVFLQLFHTACFGSTSEAPLLVHETTMIERAINILDRIYPYEVHKLGVLYINEGQHDIEAQILRNTSGSVRYLHFLQNLGTLVKLVDVNPRNIYLGGVDQSGGDGKYMYVYQDDLVMLAFHVATLMPNKENDPHGNCKKAHVGNDNVVIVYNDSGEKFDIATFRSQVTLVYIIIEPLDYHCNKIEVKVKSDSLKNIESNEVIVVSNQSLAIFVRQLAIHADLAATVKNSLRTNATDPYNSNWLERLRKLKHLRIKVIEEIKNFKDARKGFSEEKNVVEDFTDFT